MSKKNKFNTYFEKPIEEDATADQESTVDELLNPLPDTTKDIEPEVEKFIKSTQGKTPVFINAGFGDQIVEIGYVFLATNEQNVISASNGRINLMQGRMYFIPIANGTIDSDEYNIKVHSDISERFDVRFIKDGLAAVVPILHNAVLKNGERLCVLTPLNI